MAEMVIVEECGPLKVEGSLSGQVKEREVSVMLFDMKKQRSFPNSIKMGSFKLIITIFMVFSLFFLVLEPKCASSSSSSKNTIAASASQKVNLTVYYESLSKSCAEFVIRNLGEVFNGDLINIVNLHLVPWANASINSTNNSILCQHGPDECELNSVESCVLNVFLDVNKHYALIYCFEFLVIEGRYKQWQNCFNQLGLPLKPILDCFNRGNGTEDYANFTTHVCNSYNGTSLPQACKELKTASIVK
ncbi:gamma-interferon-responsive lysosomal thiol protein-like [Senna tora]|uniref:Gamma-interferon-responsive lysosomal thiol protein-like n=1 Tax=Senna tora TaxID=362788 RepID=A0A835CN88_9FABA|nr:gamma-interferon-responsive lysosomal thiol protein-like [Senna tora]